MLSLVLVAVLGVAAIVGVGILAAARPATVTGPVRGLRWRPWLAPALDRLAWVRDQTITGLGSLGSYAAFVAAGSAVVVAAFWPVGRLAYHLGPLDRRVFDWVNAHQVGGWTALVQITTQMANKQECWAVSAVACLGLAFAARRRWWVPVLLVATMVILQHYLNLTLVRVVDRGHPPTTLGSYPSGGASRAVAIYGFIFYVWFLHMRKRTWNRAVTGYTVVAVVAYLEGYSRLYLSQHWMLDVIGGWLSGSALLAVMIVAAGAFYRVPAPAATPLPPIPLSRDETAPATETQPSA